MSAVLAAICGLIPDPVEDWLAGGGNTIFIIALLAGALLWQLTTPTPKENHHG